MKAQRVLVLLCLVSVFLTQDCLEASNNKDEDDFLVKIANMLKVMCPHQDLSDEASSKLGISDGSCCTENYNSSDKGTLINENKLYVAQTFQTCMFLQTEHSLPSPQSVSFYVVVDAPENGCVQNDKGNEFNSDNTIVTEEARCDDNVTKWRQLYPVFSKSTGLIYKNPSCAFCHGANDLVYWKPVLVCFSLTPIELVNHDCDTYYYYPGPEDDVKHLQCFTGLFASCLYDDFHLPSYVNFTVNETIAACYLDTLPPFMKGVFMKNVFCYICSGENMYESHFAKKRCTIEDGDNKTGSNGFMRILDTSVLNQLLATPGYETPEYACIYLGSMKECYPILCPLGRVWIGLGRNRKCVFESKQWGGAAFRLTLLLTANRNFSVNGNDIVRWVSDGNLQSPWSKYWKLAVVSYNVNTTPADTDPVYFQKKSEKIVTNELIVQLINTKYRHEPKAFIEELDTTLNKIWELHLLGKTFTMKQSMSRYVIAENIMPNYTGDHFTGVPMWYGASHNGVLPFKMIPYYEQIHIFDYFFINVINDLMRCRQLSLPISQFSLYESGSNVVVVFSNATGFLFDQEFAILTDIEGRKEVRVCLSKFVSSDGNNVGLFLSKTFAFLALAYILSR